MGEFAGPHDERIASSQPRRVTDTVAMQLSTARELHPSGAALEEQLPRHEGCFGFRDHPRTYEHAQLHAAARL